MKAIGVGAAGLTASRLTGATKRRRPDIVLCIADDQTWTDAGCYGHPDVKTPNVDRLAGEGMRFDRAFTATAMCAPTRQQLYTGVFPVRNGAYPNHSRVHDGTKSMVHHLRALGYRVGIAGKTHFGPAASFPFKKVSPRNVGDFIGKDTAQPYCLVYASHSPHLPWTAGDASAYDAAKLTLPPYLVDTPETRKALCKYYAEITDFDREVGVVFSAVRQAGRADNTIFIVTSEQGAGVPHGKWTCYDTGLHVGFIVRWPARVKAGSVAKAMVQYVDVVPTLVEAAGGDPLRIDTGRPGAPDGGSGFDGRSFLGVLEGKTDAHHTHVFGAHTTRGIVSGSECYPVRSVRSETHKYIRNLNHETPFQNIITHGRDKGLFWESWKRKAKTDKTAAKRVDMYSNRPAEEVYDLTKDPHELTNLADDPSVAKVKADLRKRLDAWMKQQGDEGNATERKRKARGEKKAPGKKKKGKK